MQLMITAWLQPLFIYNGPAPTLPTGIVDWSDLGAILVWFVLITLVGCLLGILRERTSGRRPRAAQRVRASEIRLEEAASSALPRGWVSR